MGIDEGFTRRTLLRNGAIAAGSTVAVGGMLRWASEARAAPPINVFANAGDTTMVDGRTMHMWRFSRNTTGVKVSDWYRVIEVVENQPVTLTLKNNHNVPHTLTVVGAPGATVGPVPPGGQLTAVFPAPPVGTYVFHDPGNLGVNRALGLHGLFVVKSDDGMIKPYDSYGARGPVKEPELKQQWAWLLHAFDSSWAAKAKLGQAIDVKTFRPDYFTINGRSGWESTDAEGPAGDDTIPHGHVTVKNPPAGMQNPSYETLIRIANTTLTTHSPHIHGNHMFVMTDHDGAGNRRNGIRQAWPGKIVQPEKDAIPMRPLDVKDCRLPFEHPRDAAAGNLEIGRFPMHCHTELSQTARGGLYPNGMLTDWELEPREGTPRPYHTKL
jgi:Multicopper oxidase